MKKEQKAWDYLLADDNGTNTVWDVPILDFIRKNDLDLAPGNLDIRLAVKN